MDISSKTIAVQAQANLPKSDQQVNKGALPELVSGTNIAETNSGRPPAAGNAEERFGQELQGAVSRLNEYVQNIQRKLEFSVDEESGKDVVRVLDKQTDEVIRQIPSEEVLAIARNIAEYTEQSISIFTSQA